MRAVRMHRHGGPEVLVLEEVPDPGPGGHEVVVAVEVAGVNFTDTYRRSGFYRVELPLVPGVEAAGVVAALGAGVTHLHVGDRVAFPQSPGAYAEAVVVPARDLVRVPDWLPTEDACALMMQGLTAHYLGTSTFALGPGSTAVVHAAAGGVGRLLVQVARRCGARVIGVVSSGPKARIAREAGADHVLLAPGPDLAARVHELTGGTGADVVYDGVGLPTFRHSMAAVRPRGTLVLFGQAGGPVPPFDTLELAERSVFLTRPRLRPHVDTPHELARRAGELFAWVRAGQVSARLDRVLPLGEASAAHAYLEAGATTGKVLLRPDPRR